MARPSKHLQVLDERIQLAQTALHAAERDVERCRQLLDTLQDVRESFVTVSQRRSKGAA